MNREKEESGAAAVVLAMPEAPEQGHFLPFGSSETVCGPAVHRRLTFYRYGRLPKIAVRRK
jgi:hypothetical protein